MRSVQHLTLLSATLTTGLMAGLFFTFACAVMPALRGTDDRAFIDVMQRINVTIINPLFLSAFLGGLVLSGAAALASWSGAGRRALPWTIAGLVLYAAMFIITMRWNVPLNDRLDAAGAPGAIGDVAAVRQQFEDTWVAWNIARAVLNVAAFACLACALFLSGGSAVRDRHAAAGWVEPAARAEPAGLSVPTATAADRPHVR
jgi:uncharacterized membrane protein